MRWVSELADLKFQIYYKPGIRNKAVDGLSHMPLDIERVMQDFNDEVGLEMMHVVAQAIGVDENANSARLWVEAVTVEQLM